MNALALSPLLAYGLVAATALLIILLHLLRPRPLRRAVSSTVLWAEILRQRRKYHTPWRWLLSLLLCLLVGLALALALGRPEGFAPDQSRVVVVLDNSPSMAVRTRDGESRWQHAVAKARQVIESTSVDVMLVDTMGRAPVNGFVRPAQALEALDRFQVVTDGTARAPVLPETGTFDVHVVSDGVAAFAIPANAIVHSVYEPAVNIAVTGLQTRPFPTDPLQVEAFVQVYNASRQPMQVRLSVRGGDGFALAQELRMGAGELMDVTFDISDFDTGVLAAAAIAQDDAFPGDDIAFTMVAPHRAREVLLITKGNARLEDAIRSLPGVRMKVLAPETWRQTMRADVFVFDGFAPDQLPSGGALLFRPGTVPWISAPQRLVSEPVISDWARGNDLLDGVAWQALRVARASVMETVPNNAEALVSTGEGALITAGSSGGGRWIVAGFAPENSNLSLRPGLPVFLGNAFRWLGATDSVVSTGLGTVRLPLAQARVVDGSGQTVNSYAFAGETMFDANRPDVYTAISDEARLRVVANVLDPHDADINLTRFEGLNSGTMRKTGFARIEPWTALVAIALLFILIEWVAWTRRLAQ